MVAAGGKGPTMLLVRNKGGQVFGGYASEPWLKNGKYYGEVITSLRPSMHLLKHQLAQALTGLCPCLRPEAIHTSKGL